MLDGPLLFLKRGPTRTSYNLIIWWVDQPYYMALFLGIKHKHSAFYADRIRSLNFNLVLSC